MFFPSESFAWFVLCGVWIFLGLLLNQLWFTPSVAIPPMLTTWMHTMDIKHQDHQSFVFFSWIIDHHVGFVQLVFFFSSLCCFSGIIDHHVGFVQLVFFFSSLCFFFWVRRSSSEDRWLILVPELLTSKATPTMLVLHQFQLTWVNLDGARA